MKHWKFFDFMRNPGRDAIEEWTQSLPKPAKADFEALLSVLAVTKTWDNRDVSALRGGVAKGKGILEIKFSRAGIQYRVLGFYGLNRGEFTLLIGCTHKQRRYNPTNAIDTAIDRKNKVETRQGGICEHKI
ncbi:MAG: type II toxin-antitoxin system RelE/ParE family toxin [Deltaproteobacteria bacterium]|nr:type II toxin-antitoxin system RelE/ParE family toxin [Deltaproteobacteria bacterium]